MAYSYKEVINTMSINYTYINDSGSEQQRVASASVTGRTIGNGLLILKKCLGQWGRQVGNVGIQVLIFNTSMVDLHVVAYDYLDKGLLVVPESLKVNGIKYKALDITRGIDLGVIKAGENVEINYHVTPRDEYGSSIIKTRSYAIFGTGEANTQFDWYEAKSNVLEINPSIFYKDFM